MGFLVEKSNTKLKSFLYRKKCVLRTSFNVIHVFVSELRKCYSHTPLVAMYMRLTDYDKQPTTASSLLQSNELSQLHIKKKQNKKKTI